MDQVRAIAKTLWTQRFWVLSVICAIVGAVCWNMASSEISAQFAKQKSTIDGAFRDVTTIRNEQVHPNEKVNEGDLSQAKLQRDYVKAVWDDLYQRQRKEVLYWPKSLGKDFVEKIENKQFGDKKISSQMRDRYLNYIETRFEALQDIVKARKEKERGGGGGYGGEYGGGMGGEYGGGGYGTADTDEEPEDYLVQWLDQAKLKKKLFFKTKPSAMQVWVTQEDLWVYETLLNVLANTNKARGATLPENTAVRVIQALEVGSEAAAKAMATGQVYIPLSSGAAGGGEFGGGYGGEYGGGMGGEYGGGGYGGEYGGGMGGEYGGGYGGEYGGGGEMGADDTALLENRYLDAEGKPAEVDSGTIGTTEYRQLPIHMKLVMDQRWIPQVLIECANAALPVEVKQLRINPSKSGVGFGGSRRSNAASSGIKGVAPDVNLAEVEIRGAVYIYNEPNSEALRVPGLDEDEALDDRI